MTNSEFSTFEVKKVGKECCDDFYSLLLKSFIPEEIRSKEDARKALDNPDFILYNICVDRVSVGYISVWIFESFAFLEHFAVQEEFRGKGYGEKTVKLLLSIYPALVLECEPAEDKIKARRAAFYERCGFRKNDIQYVQPSYRKGYSSMPLMLMSHPAELTNPEEVVKQIYKKVYNVF